MERTSDRSAPQRGDRRRAALIRALDELLRERSLDATNVADIAARAGVTRSAFYFYFENKAACAAALGVELYREILAANGHLLGDEDTPRHRIRRTIEGIIAAWEGHRHLYRALLDARHQSPAVRELWDDFRESFVGPLAARIEAERATGAAPPGPAGRVLAAVLLELNDRTLEQLEFGDPLPLDERVEALVTVWLRTIYGTVAAD